MVKVTEQMILDTVESMLDKVTRKHADELKALELEIAELKGELKFYKEMHRNIKTVQSPAYIPFTPSDVDTPNETYPTITCETKTDLQKNCTLV